MVMKNLATIMDMIILPARAPKNKTKQKLYVKSRKLHRKELYKRQRFNCNGCVLIP